MANLKGNLNIALTPKTSAKTPVGKFYRNLSNFSRDKIPPELLELYDWVKQLDTKKVNYLKELKNLALVIQKTMLPKLIEKLINGETLKRNELDSLRLVKEIWTDSHKLKFGDKKIIENVVTQADLIRHMQKGKIIDVTPKNDN